MQTRNIAYNGTYYVRDRNGHIIGRLESRERLGVLQAYLFCVIIYLQNCKPFWKSLIRLV